MSWLEEGERETWLERWFLLLATLFVGVNSVILPWGQGEPWRDMLVAWIMWGSLMWGAHGVLRYRLGKYDPFLLPIYALLTGWGIILVARLAPAFWLRQLGWVGLGTVGLVLMGVWPGVVLWLRRYRYTSLLVGLGLLLATFVFGVNPSGFGATQWLQLPLVSRVFFQPSELLKLLFVIFFASYFDEERQLLPVQPSGWGWGSWPYLVPLGLMWGFCLLLLVWQRDLGAATIFFMMFVLLLYVVTGNGRYLVIGAILLMIAGIVGYWSFGVVALRVETWWNPWPEADNRAFQIVQSLYALAAGGVLGEGVGLGFPDYIPVVHSDFVLAAIGEEWGLVGSLTVVLCLMVLLTRGLRVGVAGQRPLAHYLAIGIVLLFSLQSFLIVGGVSKLVPLTGVTLPFLSYGGSSLLVSSLMMGMLIGVRQLAPLPTLPATLYPHQKRAIKNVQIGFFCLWGVVSVVLIYWGVVRAPVILGREDNPRLVEEELRLRRGDIYDADGELLATMVGDDGGRLERIYPQTGGPAVGYYSFRHGVAGIEEGADGLLRGEPVEPLDFWAETLWHQERRGQDIRLTLDLERQAELEAQLEGQIGAGILLEVPSGDILAMGSWPSYDPNLLDETFDELVADERSPLLNRVTQGAYQPGMMLGPLLWAELVAESGRGGDYLLEQVVGLGETVMVGDIEVGCEVAATAVSRLEAMAYGCPQPLLAATASWDREYLADVWARWGISEAPPVRMAVNEGRREVVTESPLVWSIMGQAEMTVSPLQMARGWGVLASEGLLTGGHLLAGQKELGGEWEVVPPLVVNERVVAGDVARAVLAGLIVEDGGLVYGREVVAGPSGERHQWLVRIEEGLETGQMWVWVIVIETVAE
ncbi:MAG TPA: FtsW/RodA/SpoVE family cell cycle protein [Anaerolineae bacterium]|nr:FtsW/RodA/SpoVE family cell cycle protein [Anaerolineae bacterium]